MGQATSIHIRPVAKGSEVHNERQKDLPHIRPELSHLNESWKDEAFPSIDEELEAIKADYLAAHGKRLHCKATPIREAVVVIQEDTTIDQLRQACRICEERWGIRAMQIYTHKDEGHAQSKEWKPNLHAHIVFCWYDFARHNTCKLDKADMAEMQTIFAECLQMQRGVSSDRKHLTSLQYKTAAEEKRLAALQDKTKLEAAKIDTILAGEEKTLRDQAAALQKEGRYTLQTFDWLQQPKLSAAVPAKKEERENRDRLEAETKKDLAALSAEELVAEKGLLSGLIGRTQQAIFRIGRKLEKLAKAIPFWKRHRLAHEAELVAEAERAHLDAKNASEAAKKAIDEAKRNASAEKEWAKLEAEGVKNEYEQKIRSLDSREERVKKGEAANRQEKKTLEAERQALDAALAQARKDGRTAGLKEGREQVKAEAVVEIDRLTQQNRNLASANKQLNEANGRLEAENQELKKTQASWLEDFRALARILTSAYPEFVKAMEDKGVHRRVGENLWNEAKEKNAKEQRSRKMGPRL